MQNTPKHIKKSGLTNIRDVYALLGVSWQTVYKWRENPSATQSRGSLKHNFIENAGLLFGLNYHEKEVLANKAGLSLGPSASEPCSNQNFAIHFNALISTFPGKKNELCQAALVSDRMFRYIKSGLYLKKEPILALLIVLGLELDKIQAALKKAGFILSKSLPNDSVIIWMLKNQVKALTGAVRLNIVNDTLFSLCLPLLMTRQKR